MVVHRLSLGFFGVNNYLVHSDNSRKALLIDACEDYQSILDKLSELNLELIYLINTHGHVDHVAGNAPIIRETGAKLMIHPLDHAYLKDPNLSLSAFMPGIEPSPEPDRLLNEGEVVELEDIRLTVLHTPGHTPGHIALVGEGEAFVGDVIFRESIGRTDFPGGSYDQLANSIRTKIYPLPDEMVLYNGHGPETTVGHEKQFNPFVRG